MILVLVHGWGFDATFWRPLRAALPEVETVALDLGFTGRPDLDIPPGPAIGVGHSLGFPWLLRRRRDWAGLVSINGFARFTRAPDFPDGTPPRVLERMRARFTEAPEAVWREFMGRLGISLSLDGRGRGPAAGWEGEGDPAAWSGCATPSPRPSPARGEGERALAAGLSWLAEWDERVALAAHAGPLLALAAADDPLVPEAMSRRSFPAETLRLRRDGGHLLPLTHPAWCAAAIREVLP